MAVQDRFSARNVYLYLVCLITLIICLVAAVQVVRSTVGIFYPDTSLYAFGGGYYPAEPGFEVDEGALEREEESFEDSQRRSEVLGVVTWGTTLLISGGLYALHWRRAQSERAAPPVPTGPGVPAGPPTA